MPGFSPIPPLEFWPYHRCVAPPTYARLTRFALWALATIVVTGAAVRLTGSGLGCEDWPTCSEDRFVADLEYHALIEFLNRLFTGVVALAVIAAVLGSWARRPRRRDLTALSLGLVAGVLAQVVLGALLVKTELDPRFTMGHFLLSMVLLYNAAVLDMRASASWCEPSRREGGFPALVRCAHGPLGPRPRAVWAALSRLLARPLRARPGAPETDGSHRADPWTRLMLRAVLAVGAVLLVTGTLVTGAGPHAGDSRAERLPLLVQEVARIHGVVALSLLVLVVWTWWRLRSAGAPAQARMGRVALLLGAQGVIGYTQYFTGVPALLVGIHVALASVVWIEIVKAACGPAAAEAAAPSHRSAGAAIAGASP